MDGILDRWHDEARRELTGMLQGGDLGRVPVRLVVDHIIESYGGSPEAYDGAYWPVFRDAAQAVMRRFQTAERDELTVASGPSSPRWAGRYRTKSRDGERPYDTLLWSLQPIRISCNCIDYRLGSLGLCKHGIAVLKHLAARRGGFTQALRNGASRPPVVWWDPIRPLEGPGDWLGRIFVRSDVFVPRRLQGLLAPVSPADDAPHRADPMAAFEPSDRARLLSFVRETISGKRRRDPAVDAWLAWEDEDEARRSSIRVPPSTLERQIASLRVDLYPYQREAVERFLASGRLLLADDMGLGKTIQAAAIAHVLAKTKKIERILVIAPASLKSQWVREWRRVTDVPIGPVEGSPDARARTYETTTHGCLVANYEQLFRDLDLVLAWNPDLIVLDEAQRIKNWQTQTAHLVKQLEPPLRLVLTGTPMENRLDELISIMEWVDPRVIAPKWRVASAHGMYADGRGALVGVKRLDVLRTRIAPVMVRRRRAEIISDLPERTDTIVSVAMTEAQQEEHDKLFPEIAKLIQLSHRRRLRQEEFMYLMSLLTTQRIVANGIAQLRFEELWPMLENVEPDETRIMSLGSPKLLHLRDLVEALVVDQGRKLVVFSQWRRALSLAAWAVRDILEGIGARAAFFTGQESQRRRTQNVVEFHDDPNLRILFCTDAGGVGLNLQRAANACVNFELPWNPAVLEQRVARLHRLGQDDPVDVFMLVSEDSIEDRILDCLSEKSALFEGLFDSDTDMVGFDTSGRFLEAVEAVLDPERLEQAARASADQDPDGPGDGIDPRIEELIDEADEATDVVGPPDLASAAGPRDTASPGTTAGAGRGRRQRLSAAAATATIGQLFEQIRIDRGTDGSVHLHAPPQAAEALGMVLTQVANLLSAAASAPAGGEASDGSTRRSRRRR